jgi:malonyl-CoA decarboxylase
VIPRWLQWLLAPAAGRGQGEHATTDRPEASIHELCSTLLAGDGEASAIVISSEILRRYRRMTAEHKADFFELLQQDFSPDPAAIERAAKAYLNSHSSSDLLRLSQAVEAPRQELLRRLNLAPRSTPVLVAMRSDLLRLLKQRPHLFAVEADFKHLLSSWFNRGFLSLRRIDWNTPAHILEKLINYESVHEIRGWDDLRRRLAEDRRCFAFFHPAMPDEPLIFVEVALVKDIPARVQPLLDSRAALMPLKEADTAVFYSINNTQLGLRGVSFGNFLIKQVMEELQIECPWIRHYVTLSPMPLFAETLRAALVGQHAGLMPAQIDALLADWESELRARSGQRAAGQALLTLLDLARPGDLALLTEAIVPVALAYLTLRQDRTHVTDPVASFHLCNGARLFRINPFADASAEHRNSAFGCMVNYLYEPDQLEIHHEAFVSGNTIALSPALEKLHARHRAILPPG